MTLYDLESLVDISLHVFVVNKMLFELLSQFTAKSLDAIDLFGHPLTNLDNFLINVSRQEVSPLSRVLSCLLDFFTKLLSNRFRIVSHRSQLLHYIFN